MNDFEQVYLGIEKVGDLSGLVHKRGKTRETYR